MKRVVLYSAPLSPFCRHIREFLATRNIPFTEYDVSEEPERLDEMKQYAHGATTVPVLLIRRDMASDMSVIVGYDPTTLEEVFSSWRESSSGFRGILP